MSIPLKSRNHVNFSAANKCHFLFKAIILDYSCKQSESLYHGLFTVHNKTKPFHDGGRYHIETSPLSKLISGANQWTGFYIITASVMKGLKPFIQKLHTRFKPPHITKLGWSQIAWITNHNIVMIKLDFTVKITFVATHTNYTTI